MAGKNMHILTEDAFLKLDKSALAGKKDASRLLLGRKGQSIPLAEAQKYGLAKGGEKAEKAGKGKKEDKSDKSKKEDKSGK